MYRAKVTAKGQFTLPKNLRTKLGIQAGNYLQIRETSEGYIQEKVQDELRFQKYVGRLQKEGDSAEMIKELRGE